MSKITKFISMFLVLTFMLSGCKSAPKATDFYEKTYLESLKKEVKEQEIDEDIYKEFLSLFNDFSGFNFEEYFFIPEDAIWTIDDGSFMLFASYIITNTKGEKLLETLRNNNDFKTFYSHSDYINSKYYIKDKGRENRAKCYHFNKEVYLEDATRINASNGISIEVLPTDNADNTYFVRLNTGILSKNNQGTVL